MLPIEQDDSLLVDTVSADKQHYEIEADDGAEGRHAAVRFDAVVHDIVPVFAC